jgi:hypothetical protein
MKHIEKLPLEKAERDWEWANVKDMFYPLIDAVNSLIGEEKPPQEKEYDHKLGCALHSEEYEHMGCTCREPSPSPESEVDIHELLEEYHWNKVSSEIKGNTIIEQNKKRMSEIEEIIKNKVK